MIAGAISHEHDVVVVVDDAGHDRASPEIDHADPRARRRRATIDGGKTAVPDRHARGNSVVAVHRVDRAVHEDELLGRFGGSAAACDLRIGCAREGSAQRSANRGGAGTEQLAA